jgi:hypothetical protein
MDTLYCRVCGFLNVLPPWGEDDDYPDYGICDCCGVEAGLDDRSLVGIRLYRKEWLDSGAKWFKPKLKPENWDLEEQMKNIPERFR